MEINVKDQHVLSLFNFATLSRLTPSPSQVPGRMALFSEGGGTFPDVLIVSFLLLCGAVGFVVNPVVFVYNSRSVKSVPQFLFRLLAAGDLITCIAIPAVVS